MSEQVVPTHPRKRVHELDDALRRKRARFDEPEVPLFDEGSSAAQLQRSDICLGNDDSRELRGTDMSEDEEEQFELDFEYISNIPIRYYG